MVEYYARGQFRADDIRKLYRHMRFNVVIDKMDLFIDLL